MTEGRIAHITSRDDWQQAQRRGQYIHPSLATDGYIHCSTFTPEQLLAVADAHFRGQPGLVLLMLDPDRLTAPLRWEEFEASGLFFPHVYGPINLEAVVQVLDFSPRTDGRFQLPHL